MTPEELGARRIEYLQAALDVTDVDPDPIVQFQRWMTDALAAQVLEPDAVALATADEHGAPSVRFLLLRSVDARGFGFVTNAESRKGTDIAVNPRASFALHWKELQRQVRAFGAVVPMEQDQLDAYFDGRPLLSRYSAWASPQGQVVPDRAWLETRVADVTAEFGDDPPRPEFWRGYVIVPEEIEFWQGRRSRLHDRVRYRRDAGEWVTDRLAP